MESLDFVGQGMTVKSEAASPRLTDMTEDALSCILSFLSPMDVSACACACRRLRELCKEERKVWLPMCHRRWGAFTNLTKWGKGRISFKFLYRTLVRWENLIGFWRGVGNGGWGSLALFDWAPHCVIGHKVVPATADSYAVRKIPFLWMGISEEGQLMSLLDPAFKLLGKLDEPNVGSSGSFGGPGRPVVGNGVSPSLPRGKPDGGVLPDMDLGTSVSRGLLLVDVHFVGNHHFVIEEVLQRCPSAMNELAEAAAVASFGSGHSLAELARRSPYSSGSETESYVGSPPGSFHYEMYQFLASKMTSAGGERAARKQKRRDRERARSQGRCIFEPEHFVKIMHSCPTKARPLQGLWKGFFDSVGLDFVLISYDDQGGIVCRKVHDLAGMPNSGSVFWTSKSTERVGFPLSLAEEELYSSRTHIRPISADQKEGKSRQASFESCEEVIGMLFTLSCDFQSLLASNKREGRIWQYSSGNFGFGYLHTHHIIDFKVLCSEGCLLDVVE